MLARTPKVAEPQHFKFEPLVFKDGYEAEQHTRPNDFHIITGRHGAHPRILYGTDHRHGIEYPRKVSLVLPNWAEARKTMLQNVRGKDYYRIPDVTHDWHVESKIAAVKMEKNAKGNTVVTLTFHAGLQADAKGYLGAVDISLRRPDGKQAYATHVTTWLPGSAMPR